MNRYLVCTAAMLALGSCTQSPSGAPTHDGELAPVTLPAGHPSLTALPDPELNNGNVGRAPRRLTVQQLKASIQTTTGKQWSQIDSLAASLGKADFALVNAESIEPNLVFAKFLEDGAREVCLNTARDDLANMTPENRVLWPMLSGTSRDFTTASDAQINANLGYLAIRFWGEPMGTEEMASYATSFKAVAARAKTINKPEQAWGAICIAMMTDPRFITY